MRKSLLILCLLPSIYAQDPGMRQAKKEAKKIGKEGVSHMKSDFLNHNLGFSEQDLLPEENKGQTFDAKTADHQFKHAAEHTASSDVRQFLTTTQKHDVLDVDEEFFVSGHQMIQNPAIDLSIETTVIPEEEQIETCLEAGTYQVSFKQELSLQVGPATKESSKICKGHKHSKSYDTVKKAKHRVPLKKKKFAENPDIKSFEVHRDEEKVTCSWTHKDNVLACNHFSTEEKIVKEGAVEEHWETDQADALSIVEANPSCKLLYHTVLKGPETRLINGASIHRDIWARHLFFSCESDSNSKCAQLRNQGAVLVRKKCLETNLFEECDLWEKTYDLGKRAASQKTSVAFQKDAIWGLENEFKTSYDKNIDFGETLATLSAFSEMESTLENQSSDLHDKVQIFQGENLKCQKSFLEGSVFDCCKKMEGLAVDVKLASCKSEEKCLAKFRSEGKCHFIGSQKAKLGTVTEHVYCCFPTKLARIIHQQGRQQLGMKWGKVDKPKCRGLSLEELQRVDFSRIDLSEVIEDINVDREAFARRLKQSVEPLQSKIQAQIVQKKGEV